MIVEWIWTGKLSIKIRIIYSISQWESVAQVWVQIIFSHHKKYCLELYYYKIIFLNIFNTSSIL